MIMNNILSQLHSMPIFRLSLGSKELFHSNFLEFLWDIDNDMFIRILNQLLLPYGVSFSRGASNIQYEFSREKENFDICIFHKENKSIVYDLIIENKVKSMPSIQQLKKYESKIKNNKGNSKKNPILLLLTLADNFSCKSDIINTKNWIVANYSQLKSAIESERTNWNKNSYASYISDYCSFIEQMHKLQNIMLKNLQNTELFSEIDLCRKYRLHDLYIKLRCSEFLMLLKDRLLQKGFQQNEISFIDNYKDIRANKKPQVYLNYNIFQGVGQAAALIYTSNTNQGDIHEIVIQGNQYRHGINSYNYRMLSSDKITSQQNIWNKTRQDKFNIDFLDKNISKPDTPKKGRKNAFNGYGWDYVYRYNIISKETISNLLDRMEEDIIKVFNKYVRGITSHP